MIKHIMFTKKLAMVGCNDDKWFIIKSFGFEYFKKVANLFVKIGKVSVFHDGYADPGKEPSFPQKFAEIMGGRILLSNNSSEMPESLYQTIIGLVTEQKIKWIEEDEI